jgi:dUTP pyrophosphatase
MYDDVVLPEYASTHAACFDIRAYIKVEDRQNPIVIKAGETKLIPTGLKMALPVDWELQIRPRSGMSLKTKIRIANSPGTCDSDYRGEIGVIVDNLNPDMDPIYKMMSDLVPLANLDSAVSYLTSYSQKEYSKKTDIMINHGDRICQGIFSVVHRPSAIIPVADWDDNETVRGAGGFGSTGVK